jgi:uncharacterized Tic20 family protein
VEVSVSQSAAAAVAVPSNAATNSVVAGLTQTAPGALPATYVETDAAQCGEAKIGHFLGIFGILGTGIWYLVKRQTAGTFVRDQMKEAFNFQMVVFCVAVGVGILGGAAAVIVGPLAMVFSLANLALVVTSIVLSVKSGMKAGKGEVARYPVRLNVLK